MGYPHLNGARISKAELADYIRGFAPCAMIEALIAQVMNGSIKLT